MPAPARPRAGAVARRLERVVAALMVWLALTATACAHASLVAAVPAQETVLGSAPAAFTLTFSEPVSPLALTLVSPDGSATALTTADFADGVVRIAAPDVLGRGTYVLSYRVVSADGHPVAGSIIFSIGAASGGGGAAPVTDWPLVAAIWTGRLLLYAGLFFGVGGAFFRAFVTHHEAGARTSGLALLAGFVGAPLSLGLLGLDALGLPLTALGRGAVWEAGL
ncbi:copper resistance CopC family protein, partial [Devosia sp.]|uniref:copper resistance CopC family protein n=1 Tax=Devosia sp. TaxID=1871048 RepID=UPI002EEACDC6